MRSNSENSCLWLTSTNLNQLGTIFLTEILFLGGKKSMKIHFKG